MGIVARMCSRRAAARAAMSSSRIRRWRRGRGGEGRLSSSIRRRGGWRILLSSRCLPGGDDGEDDGEMVCLGDVRETWSRSWQSRACCSLFLFIPINDTSGLGLSQTTFEGRLFSRVVPHRRRQTDIPGCDVVSDSAECAPSWRCRPPCPVISRHLLTGIGILRAPTSRPDLRWTVTSCRSADPEFRSGAEVILDVSRRILGLATAGVPADGPALRPGSGSPARAPVVSLVAFIALEILTVLICNGRNGRQWRSRVSRGARSQRQDRIMEAVLAESPGDSRKSRACLCGRARIGCRQFYVAFEMIEA